MEGGLEKEVKVGGIANGHAHNARGVLPPLERQSAALYVSTVRR